jgi:hypothetical protein
MKMARAKGTVNAIVINVSTNVSVLMTVLLSPPFCWLRKCSVTRPPKSRAALNSTPVLVTELAWSCAFGCGAEISYLLPGSVAMTYQWRTANMAGINENDFRSRLPTTAFSAYDFGLRGSADQNEQTCNSNRLHRSPSFSPFLLRKCSVTGPAGARVGHAHSPCLKRARQARLFWR